MNKNCLSDFRGLCFKALCISVLLFWSVSALAYPLTFKDDRGKTIRLERKPERVVCLVPSITEVIFEIGAGDCVKGVTFHDLYPPEAATRKSVGGFFSPSTEKIRELAPDLLIVADLHRERTAEWETLCPVIQWNCGTIEKAYGIMVQLGVICDRENDARALVNENKSEMERIGRIVAAVPPSERKRVLRLMGRNSMMTAGDDSFQNELIRAAGGISPRSGKKGAIVPFDLEQWKAFNPQMIYGCGGDRSIETGLLSAPGWKDVEAVRSKAIRYYPCDLTCRASGRMGVFVSALAADLYPHLFVKAGKASEKPKTKNEKELFFDLPYVKHGSVKQSVIFGFIQKSLVIEFKTPLDVLSTLEGYRTGITWAGNHYFPPQTWTMGHDEGLEGLKKRTFQALKLDDKAASFLFTGADMDHLVVKEKTYEGMKVVALVTAGVRGNALRTSKDKGDHVEPGTINIMIMTSRCLSQGAMGRAIVTATEAKTAALMDLDIRSSYSSRFHQATGTGTDNVLVIQGMGNPLENTGGHSKMGELIGSAVYEAVKEAIFKQNGLVKGRSIYHRMMERDITFASLLDASTCDCAM